MPRVPTLADLVALLQAQTDALAALPRTLVDLNRSILSLIEVLTSVRETVASTQRLTQRLDRIVDELEEPVLAMRPGLERVAAVLNDPVVDTVPDTLRTLSDQVVPLVHGLREAQAKISALASSPERLLGLVDEASARFANSTLGGLWRARRSRNEAAHRPDGPPTKAPRSEDATLSFEVVERVGERPPRHTDP